MVVRQALPYCRQLSPRTSSSFSSGGVPKCRVFYNSIVAIDGILSPKVSCPETMRVVMKSRSTMMMVDKDRMAFLISL
jgi:hypothetical protein